MKKVFCFLAILLLTLGSATYAHQCQYIVDQYGNEVGNRCCEYWDEYGDGHNCYKRYLSESRVIPVPTPPPPRYYRHPDRYRDNPPPPSHRRQYHRPEFKPDRNPPPHRKPQGVERPKRAPHHEGGRGHRPPHLTTN